MKKRVLVINCGMMVSTYINTALKDNDEYEIWGSSTYENHGKYVYKNYIEDIPNIKDSNFIDVLNQKIKEYNFKFILVGHDDLVLFLQENKDKINATIVSPDYDAALLSRYKSKLYEKLKNYDFVPKTYKKQDVKEYPVFVKEDDGQGSRNAYKVNNVKELNLYTENPKMIICEYLPGEEVGVDCFTDKNGNLLFCNPRVVDRMLAGIDIHARRIELTEEIKNIANALNREIKFRGNWLFQIKKDINGKFKLLEIASRLSSSFSISRCLDINLPLLALKDFDNQDISFTFNKNENIEMDQQFVPKYFVDTKYDEVYVDFKSCFKDNIDTFFMMYLYQCENKNIKINLLTERRKTTLQYLKDKKISKDLFEIIETDKTNFKKILKNNSILISNDDNLKKEIRENNANYNCFSNNTIEALIDWRA